jgi:membrane protein
MTALNIAYDVSEARPWWKRRLVAIGLTFGFVVFLVVALTLMVFGPRQGEALAIWLGFGSVFAFAWSVASVPVAIALVLTGIALVYHLAPAVRQRWRWITLGSVLAVTLWLVASMGLRLYLMYFDNYTATYGSIGGVILLLLWLYLTGIALTARGRGQRGDRALRRPARDTAHPTRGGPRRLTSSCGSWPTTSVGNTASA